MIGQPKRSGKRPWLAALLGTLVTGLGHVYLRRWLRGVGWFAVAVAASALFVPPEAAEGLLSGSGGDLDTLAPLLVVGLASVADAYVLARASQREASEGVGATPSDDTATGAVADGRASAVETRPEGTGETAECPECGKDLDPDLDFCPWCTARLSDPAEE
jgi:hypothetical protein